MQLISVLAYALVPPAPLHPRWPSCARALGVACCADESPISEPTEDLYGLRFDGVRRLYGDEAPGRLRASRVVVVGLGGVGSWAVEALARSGVGSLTLIDLDEICISNTNRQIHALHDTVGQSKARALASRVREINPECEVTVREEWVLSANADDILSEEMAASSERGETLALLDAVDGYKEKAAMVVAAQRLGIHMVLAGAVGGKADPTRVRIGDLTRTTNDNLLRAVRRTLRRKHGFPTEAPARSRKRAPLKWGVPCVYSEELAQQADGEGTLCDRFGTACFSTGAFGFAAASHITAVLARGEATPKRPRYSLPGYEKAGKDAGAEPSARRPAATARSAEPTMAVEAPVAAEDAVGQRESSAMAATTAPSSGPAAQPTAAADAGASADAGAASQASAASAVCEPCDEAAQHDPLAVYDSHCHAIDEAAALLDGPTAGGLCLMATGEPEWPRLASTAASSSARCALGVHPWHVHAQVAGWEARLRLALLAHPAAAVGEAGLDRARLDSPFDAQLAAFGTQLRLAAELRRPLVVHCVRCDGKLLELLRAAGSGLPPVLVMHAFGGSPETAANLLRLGEGGGSKVFFGFSARAAALRRAAAVIQAVPADRLLLESDEHTAERAQQAVAEACARLAAARSWSREEAAERTAANGRAAFEPAGWGD